MFFWWKNLKTKVDDLKIQEQLVKQVAILQSVGILEILENEKSLCILGIDNKKYNVPTLEEILQRIEDKKELVRKKMEQGFTKIIIVPFACSLEKIIKKYEETLINHSNNDKLLATKENTSDIDNKLELDIKHPINTWNEYKDGDIKNNFIYFPKKYDKENHGGKTKLELLANPKNAWQIFLIENMPNIPSFENAKKINHRKQIETNKTPKEYMEMLQSQKIYEGEEGLTPEADLIYAITYLEETNQVINDWQGKGNLSYELGAFFISSNSVPCLGWDQDFNRVDLWKFSVDNRDPHTGVRVGIKI